jgi:predicted nucleic-acid-binding protein
VIALDTNIVVRLIMQDDASQARAAERVLVRARRDGHDVFISDIVLCELAWVLRARYRLARADIAAALDTLLRTELIVVDDAGRVDRALAGYRGGPGDFADYLIREHANAAGTPEVVTLDRAVKGEPGFRLAAS